ncbi:thioredoxin family protein [Lutibacter holmesii]|uniref:Thioredoxin family protein n=1 Tax=Lutibacter holmesii TaxID=1137985 RepID=A0ABW3WLH9_9FLAO
MKKILCLLLIVGSFSTSLKASTNWLTSFDDAKKMSQALNKPILVDFWAFWCGPCKEMDQNVWSKEDIKSLMDNFVPVKIDIDANVGLARTYNVRAIPHILILDGWGNILYTSVGYKDKKEITALLESFSVNMAAVHQGLAILEKDKENAYSNVRVAQKFQDGAFILKGESKKAFLRSSNSYFKEGLKFVPKDKPALKEKVELFMALNKAYGGSCKSVLKGLHKALPKIDASNKSLYYYIEFYCYHTQKDETKATESYSKLAELNSNTYLKKANYLIKKSE